MKIDFPYANYKDIPPFDVPDSMLMGIYTPEEFPQVDEQAELKKGFENPIGAPHCAMRSRAPRPS